MTLNGESWKNRGQTTYTSLLDRYGASGLFSGESMEAYQEIREKKGAGQQALTEYVFSGKMQAKGEEGNVADLIFSQEIRFSKLRDYNRGEKDDATCFVMGEMLFVLAFLCALVKINAGRRKGRGQRAVKVDVEG